MGKIEFAATMISTKISSYPKVLCGIVHLNYKEWINAFMTKRLALLVKICSDHLGGYIPESGK